VIALPRKLMFPFLISLKKSSVFTFLCIMHPKKQFLPAGFYCYEKFTQKYGFGLLILSSGKFIEKSRMI